METRKNQRELKQSIKGGNVKLNLEEEGGGGGVGMGDESLYHIDDFFKCNGCWIF